MMNRKFAYFSVALEAFSDHDSLLDREFMNPKY